MIPFWGENAHTRQMLGAFSSFNGLGFKVGKLRSDHKDH